MTTSKPVVGPSHPLLPKLTERDVLVRHASDGWHVEDAAGHPICETLSSLAEARLVGRTCVPSRGRVWVRGHHGWVLLDED